MNDKLFSFTEYLRHFFTARRKGHGVHSPFAYRLCEDVFYSKEIYYDFEKLAAIRKELLADKRIIEVTDLGAPSRMFRSTSRKIKDIARYGISNKKKSQLQYRLINYLKLKNVLEIGGSLGLNALYLSKATVSGKVISLEGNQWLYNFARDLARKCKADNLVLLNGLFSETLPLALTELGQVDFVLMDGDHSEQGTLRYFEQLLPFCGEHTVIALDDIYWSPGMKKAWLALCAHPRVTLSIDLFEMGLLFFRNEFLQKTHLRIFL